MIPTPTEVLNLNIVPCPPHIEIRLKPYKGENYTYDINEGIDFLNKGLLLAALLIILVSALC
jgi:hypothetical protein